MLYAFNLHALIVISHICCHIFRLCLVGREGGRGRERRVFQLFGCGEKSMRDIKTCRTHMF